MDGQIVFDGVTATSSGSVHATHGPVTPVDSHTFHGGIDSPPDSSTDHSLWWEDSERLNRHRLAMGVSFPDWSYLPAASNRGPSWTGIVNTGRGRFLVAIDTRRDGGLPTVRVLGPKLGVNAGKRWVPSPHLYLSGNLCVAEQSDWDPARHTVATVVGWAAHWLAAYTEWRMSRIWPVEGTHKHAA